MNENNLFTNFFCSKAIDPELRKSWLEKHLKAVINDFQKTHGQLLESFFTLDDLLANVKIYVMHHVTSLIDTLLDDLSIAVNIEKVKKLRNYASCGDISFPSFRTWARELDLPEKTIEELYSPDQVTVYVCEALQTKSSRDRLSKDLPSIEESLNVVRKRVREENARTLRVVIFKGVSDFAAQHWKDSYYKVHNPLVMPMSQEEIIEAAQSRGIEVTYDTFAQTYRYNSKVGLLRNACQIPGCPHYLQPHNNFNQHISVEREQEQFPHAIHLISNTFYSQGINSVIQEVTSGNHTGTQNRRRPTPPLESSLVPLMEQLGTLLNHYAATSQK
ncbi:hypothetical protein SK128_018413 [Halocaridina rubra]|uniref:Uncharacterized protein n=1 Tax=Halocaridina rubra TaxID=373956 RepID=A0AAN8X572_HALRR